MSAAAFASASSTSTVSRSGSLDVLAPLERLSAAAKASASTVASSRQRCRRRIRACAAIPGASGQIGVDRRDAITTSAAAAAAVSAAAEPDARCGRLVGDEVEELVDAQVGESRHGRRIIAPTAGRAMPPLRAVLVVADPVREQVQSLPGFR